MTPRFESEPLSATPPVVMFTAPNPGPKTLTGTHTYVIGHRQAYILDPGPRIEEYQRRILAWLTDTGTNLRAILLSHGHPDHAPGASILEHALGVPVYGSIALDEIEASVSISHRYAANQEFDVDGDRLRVLAAPGHSRDHVAFSLLGARILFSGDTILGEGSSLVAPPEGDMLLYMETLDMLQHLDARLIAPGHGPLIHDPRAKIEEYIAHRNQREKALLQALSAAPATPHELVERLYKDTDPRLFSLAESSVRAQLAKLEAEGLVHRVDATYALT